MCQLIFSPIVLKPFSFQKEWEGGVGGQGVQGAGSPGNRGPGARFLKVPVTFRARNQIFKSKYKE